jgi:hypothetical protein
VSVPVELGDLGAHVAERGAVAYLLTVSDDGRPHAVRLPFVVVGAALHFDAGNRSATNAASRPDVSLLWAARDDGDYSLIVDGDAVVVGKGPDRRVAVTPARAVLHRPAAAGADVPASTCGADCVPLDLPAR